MATTPYMWSIEVDRIFRKEMEAWEQEALENYIADGKGAVQCVWQYASKSMAALIKMFRKGSSYGFLMRHLSKDSKDS